MAHSSILSGKSHGQRSLVGYSPWDRKRVGHNLVTTHTLMWDLSSQTRDQTYILLWKTDS